MPSAGRAWLGEGGGDSAAVGLKRLATLMGRGTPAARANQKNVKSEPHGAKAVRLEALIDAAAAA